MTRKALGRHFCKGLSLMEIIKCPNYEVAELLLDPQRVLGPVLHTLDLPSLCRG